MKKQNNKIKMVVTLVSFGFALSLGSIASSSTGSFASRLEINERLREAKPIAGRNRRRNKPTISISRYPKANTDEVRISPQINKQQIDVLSNDDGHKLRVVKINPRSARGARVSIRNGIVVYHASRYFVGKDSFWYTMQDLSGHRHSAKVIVCVCDK